MMEEILKLQSNIRTKKEKERAIKTSSNERYTDIFKPITTTLEKLKPSLQPPAPPPPPPPQLVLQQQQHQKEEGGEEGELKSEEEEDEEGEYGDEEEEEDMKEDTDEIGLYDNVLASILESDRDDGVFGLKVNPHNPRVGQIGRFNFRVTKDNKIDFHSVHRKVTEAHITDPYLWALLLVKNPNRINLELKTQEGKYKKFVLDYMKIVDGLDLVTTALANPRVSVTNRIKYKLIKAIHMDVSGSGFLFSVRPPPLLAAAAAGDGDTGKRIKPSTVVIPSDKKGLLRELVKAVAEFRAGNKSMRNLVVPLAQEAKRKKILPRHLLSADEKTWVFA